MGRKRQLQLASAPKRRTVLQLDDNRGTTNNRSSPVTVKQGNSLGLISHYGEDSEEEEEEEVPAKPKTEIDLKVADFLAEIEALDTPTGSGSNTPREEIVDEESVEVSEQPAAQTTEQSAEQIGEWQELLDPNTNCMYFWNTVTNEVTWELPQSLQNVAEPSTSASSVTTSANHTINNKHNINKEAEPSIPEVPEVPENDTEDMEVDASPAFPLFGPKAPKPDLDADLSKASTAVNQDLKKEKPDISKEYGIFVKGEPLVPSNERDYDIFADKSPVKEVKEGNDVQGRSDNEDDHSMESEEKEDGSTIDGQAAEEEDAKDSALEFDEDDIDAQLEMALEQKKAELRVLDEIEPSDSSEEVTTVQKRKQDEMSENIYTENGEINLLPFKKKRMEMLKGQKQALMEDKATQCDDLDVAEAANEKTKQKSKEEADLKAEIAGVTSDLKSKLGFLGMSRKDLNKFHILLIEIETRVQDWRDGILDGKHLKKKLEIANWELELYEREAAPPSWTCAWDRTHKLYYYVNNNTGDSQWEYPLEALQQHKQTVGSEGNHDQFVCKDTFNQASSVGGYNNENKDETGHNQNKQKEMDKISKEPIEEPRPSIDVDISSEVSSAPPLPDEPPPPPPPELDIPPPPLPSSPPPPLPPRPPPDFDSDSEPLPPGVSPPPSPPPEIPPMPSEPLLPQEPVSIVSKPVVRYVNPVSVVNPPIMMVPSYSAVPVQPTLYAQPTVAPQPPPPQPVVKKEPVPVKTKTKKTKKIKKNLANKTLPLHLVEKWKQIKEEQEKEEEVVEEEEEDMETMNQRRIEEWKEKQRLTGKASYNANFETIKGDWRERLKRKTTKS
ncbi:formin-binding protein 4-like [Antedon mediterranea]|uniref:formin-binding protein 4-like n=1 Tax=Antedon mediterranea TaxID=105859 RepID=UPI003AF525C7